MKTMGLIGGLSWESSIEYYRIINETVKERLGGLHSAKSVMFSFDFEEIERLQRQDRWDEATGMMVEAAQSLERAGADFVLICSNTMHRMAGEVEAAIAIPLLHIADATAAAIKAASRRRVGLLGTRYTMEQDFYKGRLAGVHGLEVLIPDEAGRQTVHEIIYNELVRGEIRPTSREQYRAIMAGLVAAGAEGIILGCTEIGLLVRPEDSAVPLFDTTRLHAVYAVEQAMASTSSTPPRRP